MSREAAGVPGGVGLMGGTGGCACACLRLRILVHQRLRGCWKQPRERELIGVIEIVLELRVFTCF
eukprot:6180825-Pleurochrysis_carterae.AAC.3